MALNPTTIKLTDADEEVVAELQERHGHTTLIGTIRDALLYTLINKPIKQGAKKTSKKSGKSA